MGLLFTVFGGLGIAVLFLSFGLYAVLQLLCGTYFRTQNLKRRYNAQWGLVTGSSSGIGKSIARKLASQGLNVVLVALDDATLEQTCNELKTDFPNVEVRKVGADLSKHGGYIEEIIRRTSDIDVQVVFCNAGYILAGFFYTRPVEQIEANIECNAMSAVNITHHFLTRMVDKKLRGCFVFTSSASAVLPSPFCVSYASTKAFLSMFAISLAPEVKAMGIDVLAVHPSPVASRFYDNQPSVSALEFFQKLAVQPEQLPDIIFASIGRCIWKDIGHVAIGFRLLEKIIDLGAMFTAVSPLMHLMPDFKKQMQDAREAAAKAKRR